MTVPNLGIILLLVQADNQEVRITLTGLQAEQATATAQHTAALKSLDEQLTAEKESGAAAAEQALTMRQVRQEVTDNGEVYVQYCSRQLDMQVKSRDGCRQVTNDRWISGTLCNSQQC